MNLKLICLIFASVSFCNGINHPEDGHRDCTAPMSESQMCSQRTSKPKTTKSVLSLSINHVDLWGSKSSSCVYKVFSIDFTETLLYFGWDVLEMEILMPNKNNKPCDSRAVSELARGLFIEVLLSCTSILTVLIFALVLLLESGGKETTPDENMTQRNENPTDENPNDVQMILYNVIRDDINSIGYN